MYFRMELILIIIGNIIYRNLFYTLLKFVIINRINYLARRRKDTCRLFEIPMHEETKKRAFAGMSSGENADVTLTMPSDMAELAEKDFLILALCLNFHKKGHLFAWAWF